jgi:hypothetical protein
MKLSNFGYYSVIMDTISIANYRADKEPGIIIVFKRALSSLELTQPRPGICDEIEKRACL